MAPTPVPALDLKIPASSSTVSVRIINTTGYLSNAPIKGIFEPIHPQFTHLKKTPCFSFLIEHPSNRKLLFDLGIRKDYLNLAPSVVNANKSVGWKIDVASNVRDQLEDHGVKAESIEAIIWSHWHWDHIGDASTFPPSTAVIVGPGFKNAFVPGYPTNPEAPIQESDYEGRELREVAFDGKAKIGNFGAFDYFGDGSFYLLDAPGHAVGHMCGLARVKVDGEGGDHFILMGGDACHHGGEFKPSKYLPLPDSITPNPFKNSSENACPGAIFESLLRGGDATKPIFTISAKGIHHDVEVCKQSVEKVMEADGNGNVFTVIAHDGSLLNLVDFFPKHANGFKEKSWVENGRWAFLQDLGDSTGSFVWSTKDPNDAARGHGFDPPTRKGNLWGILEDFKRRVKEVDEGEGKSERWQGWDDGWI